MENPSSSITASMEIDGRKLEYTATAGFLPGYGERDEITSHWFYVSYQVMAEGTKKRPITFVFNGGPGSASLLLHIGALGPRTLPMPNQGLDLPRPPYILQNNAQSILDLTDLVFIDPIGTGFSRARDADRAKDFWGVKQDVNSVAEFIRVYLTRYRRWNSPLFILGESYGGLRGAGLATRLQDLGMMPSGLIFVSPAMNMGDLAMGTGHDRLFLHTLPTLAATAWYHRKLDSTLLREPVEKVMEAAREWVNGEYLSMLWKGNHSLSAQEHQHAVDRLTHFTGLPREEIVRENLRVPFRHFAARLFGEERRFCSIYDGRMTTPGTSQTNYEDPCGFQLVTTYMSAFSDYLAEELGFLLEREYYMSSDSVSSNWDYSTGIENPKGGGYAGTLGSLACAMRRCPFLKVFVGAGYFDLHCCIDSDIYELGHLDIPKDRMDNITVRGYFGGHMFYSNPEAHARFRKDLVAFYAEALGEQV